MQLWEGYANKAIFFGKFLHLHQNGVWLRKKNGVCTSHNPQPLIIENIW